MDPSFAVSEAEWLKDGGKSRLGRSPSTPLSPMVLILPPYLKQRSNSSPPVSCLTQVDSTPPGSSEARTHLALSNSPSAIMDPKTQVLPQASLGDDSPVDWASATVDALDQISPAARLIDTIETSHRVRHQPDAEQPLEKHLSLHMNVEEPVGRKESTRQRSEGTGDAADAVPRPCNSDQRGRSEDFENEANHPTSLPEGTSNGKDPAKTSLMISDPRLAPMEAVEQPTPSVSNGSTQNQETALVQETTINPQSKSEGSTPQQKRLHALTNRNANLQQTLDELTRERNKLAEQLRDLTVVSERAENATTNSNESKEMSDDDIDGIMRNAKATIKEHITLLHRYNDIRDIAQGLMGMIADQRGVRMRDVQEDFGLDETD